MSNKHMKAAVEPTITNKIVKNVKKKMLIWPPRNRNEARELNRVIAIHQITSRGNIVNG